MTEQLNLRITTVDGCRVVEVSGEIDISSEPELRMTIESELAAGVNELVVDLSGVRFMDSTGLNLLMSVAKQLGPESFGVAGTQTRVDRIFTLTGSDKVIPRFDSVAEAIDSMRRGGRR